MQLESNNAPLLEETTNFLRLQSIFMPYATEQRQKLHERNARFVHYTSAEAALSIIKSKRLWMRNTNCMSDFSEVQHGYDILERFFSDGTRWRIFGDALDVHFPGVMSEAIQHFHGWRKSYLITTYIASISEHDDKEDQDGRLSMWRAFGGSNAKVALVFRVPKYVPGQGQLGIMFSPVAYFGESEVRDQLISIADSIPRNEEFLRSMAREQLLFTLFDMLISAMVCLKHTGFHEEREWRVIYNPSRGRSPLIDTTTEVIGGIPQSIHKLPLDKNVSDDIADLDLANMFDRLIIGPSQYPTAISEALTSALTNAGVSDAWMRVCVSDIPLRT